MVVFVSGAGAGVVGASVGSVDVVVVFITVVKMLFSRHRRKL